MARGTVVVHGRFDATGVIEGLRSTAAAYRAVAEELEAAAARLDAESRTTNEALDAGVPVVRCARCRTPLAETDIAKHLRDVHGEGYRP